MARIAGIDLPKDKRIEIGLTYIYGIGRKSAQEILAQTGVNPDTRVWEDRNQIKRYVTEVYADVVEMLSRGGGGSAQQQ